MAGRGKVIEIGGGRLSTTGVFAGSDTTGFPAIGASSASDTFTLNMISGQPFELRGLELATTTGSSTRELRLNGLLPNGTIAERVVTLTESGGFESVALPDFGGPLQSLSWSLEADEWLRSVEFEENRIIDFDVESFDTKRYVEEGLAFTTDGNLKIDDILGGLFRQQLRIDEASNFSDLVIHKADGGAFRREQTPASFGVH